MRITAIETVHVGAYPNITFVEVHTDEGLIGLGETFRTPRAVAAQIHETVAPYLLGKNPLTIDAHSSVLLNPYLGFGGSGVEIRAASAVDIALWDLWGKVLNRPVHDLLGGLTREKIRVYNTCAGYAYNQAGGTRRLVTADSGDEPAAGPYEDQVAFTRRPAELAQSLLDMGITAMKIWPFDSFAVASGGRDISMNDLKAGLEPFRRIREAVGDRMDIMCEFHSLWNLPTAVRIADALAEYNVYWSEDPIKMIDLDVLADYRRRVRIPVCASETLATRQVFRDLLARQAVDYVMLDLGWCGGLSEAKKIAAIAESWLRPIAPHDCTGPVVLIASLHLALNAPNALFQEVVRAYYTGWYKELVTELPRIENGEAHPMTGPGLGTALLPDLKQRPDVTVQRSAIRSG
jgi:L-alanine-DL-glutamate epimerase-like enolase superfamily enzyme